MSAPAIDYAAFLAEKAQLGAMHGFEPRELPAFLFDFQRELVTWALRKGRAAIFADTGLGKTAMQLAWADAVARREGRPVLLLTPLAVGAQTLAEGERFGIDVVRSRDGVVPPGAGVVVTNYEQLHRFDRRAFCGAVCDESSILKSFDGVRRGEITAFLRHVPYRLLCTATAAPNDVIELGTSAEALGEMGYMDMLGRFFHNDHHNAARGRYFGRQQHWRLKGHAERPFWRWVCSWARSVRRPSDLGFPDDGFVLPPLTQAEHVVDTATVPDGWLFAMPAQGLVEQRDERRRTLEDRCARVAALVDHARPALVWCHLNTEGDLLERLIPGAVQVRGGEPDEAKEDKLLGFARGAHRVLVTKPTIAGWGLNFQHCAHVTFFPSHSFEQFYQGVRRCWRFGQRHPVHVDVITTEGERGVLANLRRKEAAAARMFDALVAHMAEGTRVERRRVPETVVEVPAWI